MKNAARLPALAGAILITTVSVACSRVPLAPPPVPEPAESSPSAAPVEPQTGWADILGPLSAPKNWRVTPCTNSVLLCVEADGELIGTVERFSYPLSEANVQGGLPLPEGSEREFLQAWVTDHYTTIEQDRKVADPALRFVGETPTAITVGNLPGLRYGYRVTHPNGALFDRGVGYVTTDGNLLHVFVTGAIGGDPSGSFSDEAAVEAFEPHLDRIIQGLSL